MTSIRTIFVSSYGWAALVAGILLNLGHAFAGVTINAASPKFIDVQLAVSSANDGDTVLVPAGTSAWTSSLYITNKGITLIGATTTNSVAGTAVDNTIIQDNVTRVSGQPCAMIIVQGGANKTTRISGFTFQPLSTGANNQGAVIFGNSLPVTAPTNSRLDHCHFQDGPHWAADLFVSGWVYGVADHNVMEFGSVQNYSFHLFTGYYGSDSTAQGDISWSSPTNFGSGDFFFIEDNYVHNNSRALGHYDELVGCTDATNGARYVFRHNTCLDIEVHTHGTESGRYRGNRALEIYNNTFNCTGPGGGGGIRSGTLISHDNTWAGTKPNHQAQLNAVRTTMSYYSSTVPWGGASGDNVWDANDTSGTANNTTGSGSSTSGQPPFLYDSGTVTSGSGPDASGFVYLTDTTKSWTTNQWANFTAKRVSDNQIDMILSNTNNTLKMLYYADSGGSAKWSGGGQYQIHKVVVVMDQAGRGVGDRITGTITSNTINSVTGTRSWPRNALEPCYSFNDVFAGDGSFIKLQGGFEYTMKENRDYYNQAAAVGGVQTTGVGVGTLANRPGGCVTGADVAGGASHPGVGYWATDTHTLYVATATNTWTQYYQPYTYPHPLVAGGAPAAPQNLRVTGP